MGNPSDDSLVAIQAVTPCPEFRMSVDLFGFGRGIYSGVLCFLFTTPTCCYNLGLASLFLIRSSVREISVNFHQRPTTL